MQSRLLGIMMVLSMLQACGGGSEAGQPPTDGAFEERCQNHCDTAGANTTNGDCSEDEKSSCLTNCRAQTSGLAFSCGACLVDGGKNLQAEESSSSCYGGSVAKLGDAECESFCVDAGHPGDSSDLEIRCQNHCDTAGANTTNGDCSEDEKSSCLTNCRAQTSGLAFSCGACLVDSGKNLQAEESSSSCYGGSVAKLGDAECEDFCR